MLMEESTMWILPWQKTAAAPSYTTENSYNTEVIRGEEGKSYDVNLFYRSYHVD